MKHETPPRKVICFFWAHHRTASRNHLMLCTMWKNLSHVHPSGLVSITIPPLVMCSLSLSAVKKLAPFSNRPCLVSPPPVQRCVQTLTSNLQAVSLAHLPPRISVRNSNRTCPWVQNSPSSSPRDSHSSQDSSAVSQRVCKSLCVQ